MSDSRISWRTHIFGRRVQPFPRLIRSFAILPLSVFVPDAGGVYLVSFQSTTVSRSHVTAGYILERLSKHVEKSGPRSDDSMFL